MRKTGYLLQLLLLCFGLASCGPQETEEHLLGENLIENSTSVKLIDTLQIRTSTILLDSLRTSGYNRMLVGQYTDPYMGKTRAAGYCKVGLNGIFQLDKYAEFDSLVLITHYSDYFYGDTTQWQSISVHRLNEELEGSEEDGTLYNNHQFSYEQEPLGQLDFQAKPTKEDELTIRLSDELGREFLELAKAHEEKMEDFEEFEDYFQGLALVPGDEDASVIGLTCQDTSFKMRLYYHNTNEVDEDRYYDFTIKNTSLQFSNITSERSGTLVEDLKEQRYGIDSRDMLNSAYIQSGVGLAAHIEIPYVKNILKLGDKGGLMKAQLVFYPIRGSWNEHQYLPGSLNLYLSDDRNRILEPIVSSETGNPIEPVFYQDDEFDEDTRFEFDVSNYINYLLNESTDTDNSLVVIFPLSEFSSSVNRLVLGDHYNSDFKLKLKVTYVVQE
ncbi:MAG: DUF4270 family protein [Marinifilaceae bacterium]|jgi:hypothetical protein